MSSFQPFLHPCTLPPICCTSAPSQQTDPSAAWHPRALRPRSAAESALPWAARPGRCAKLGLAKPFPTEETPHHGPGEKGAAVPTAGALCGSYLVISRKLMVSLIRRIERSYEEYMYTGAGNVLTPHYRKSAHTVYEIVWKLACTSGIKDTSLTNSRIQN